MTVAELRELLARYPDNARVFVWPFNGPSNASSVSVGSYLPAETVESTTFPATLCLKCEKD